MKKKQQPKNSLIKAVQSGEVADALYERIASVIREARATVIRSIDTTMVKAYWHIGRHIVEEESREGRNGLHMARNCLRRFPSN